MKTDTPHAAHPPTLTQRLPDALAPAPVERSAKGPSRSLLSVVFAGAVVLGLAIVVWVGLGHVSASPLALGLVGLIGVAFVAGAGELLRVRADTRGLARVLDETRDTPPSAPMWLDRLPVALQQPVRQRLEGERAMLPGPVLTHYLVGLLVLLGMLGTFLGMVTTLRGTGLALETAVDVAAIRASLAAPVKGLGLAFGASVAGVATSALLGLLAALVRRERQAVWARLEAAMGTRLRGLTRAQRIADQQAAERAADLAAARADELARREAAERALDAQRAQAEAALAAQAALAEAARAAQAARDDAARVAQAAQDDAARQHRLDTLALQQELLRTQREALEGQQEAARLQQETMRLQREAAQEAAREAARLQEAALRHQQELARAQQAAAGVQQAALDHLQVWAREQAATQGAAMAGLLEKLHGLVAQIDQNGQTLHQGLLDGQGRFHDDARQAYATLADTVGRSLEASLAESARQAGAAFGPAVRETMDTVARETAALRDTLGGAVQRQIDEIGDRLESTTAGLADRWQAAMDTQQRQGEAALHGVRERAEATAAALQAGLDAFTQGFEQRSAALVEGVASRFDQSATHWNDQWTQGWGEVLAAQRAAHDALVAQQRETQGVLAEQQRGLHDALAGEQRGLLAALSDDQRSLHQSLVDQHRQLHDTLAEQQRSLHGSLADEQRMLLGSLTTEQRELLTALTAEQRGLASSLTEAQRDLVDALTSQQREALEGIVAAQRDTHAALDARHQQTHEALVARHRDAHDQLVGQQRDFHAAQDDRHRQTHEALVGQHRGAHEALLQFSREQLSGAVEGLASRGEALLGGLAEARSQWDEHAANRERERMTAFHEALAAMAATWQREGAQVAEAIASRQQLIVDTLERSAGAITAQAEAHTRATVDEIGRMLDAAAEAPKAAAEVMGELRAALSDSLARDTAQLEERNRLIGTLGTLLDAVNAASHEQREAIDGLVSTTTKVLEQAGSGFATSLEHAGERFVGSLEQAGGGFAASVERGSASLAESSAQVAGSAAEMAAMGEGFGTAVQLFGRASEQLMGQLGRIESALGQSMARSDEQLAYYVAQAREIVDLTLGSQKQIVEDMQKLAQAPKAVAESSGGTEKGRGKAKAETAEAGAA